MELKAYPAYGGGDFKLLSHEEFHPNAEARLAIELVAKWGVVAAVPAGEDSAGRQKLDLQEPNDLVARACETAEIAYRAFAERGWMVKGPTLAECEEVVANKKRERV